MSKATIHWRSDEEWLAFNREGFVLYTRNKTNRALSDRIVEVAELKELAKTRPAMVVDLLLTLAVRVRIGPSYLGGVEQ